MINPKQIKNWGYNIGFDLIGITAAQPVVNPHTDAFNNYLANGRQGDMQYLSRHLEKRLDVRRLVPGARSVICTALNYYHEAPKPNSTGPCGKIARYAWGRDYHDVIKEKLHRLADHIKTAVDTPVITRCFVDTAPILEKACAARAGLGWIGKNTLLLNEKFGSWLVLGEIVTDLELDYDEPIPDRCGDCEQCLHACPTNALIEPRILDARRCISYLTVESKSQVPTDLQSKIGNRLFGCDECQNVCPFNQMKTPSNEPDFKPINVQLDLDTILSATPEQLQQRFTGTSLSRMNYEYLQQVRNSGP
jgi:epoxyqueuosine reductase